jgi:purine-binding chemotaxis protein CheW
VIPIVDLRVKFGLPADLAERTCIVVVQIKLPTAQTVQIGLIVDSVEEVVTLAANEIEPTPDFGAAIGTDYLLGMAKVKGQVKTLLDIDRVVAPDAVQAIVQAL